MASIIVPGNVWSSDQGTEKSKSNAENESTEDQGRTRSKRKRDEMEKGHNLPHETVLPPAQRPKLSDTDAALARLNSKVRAQKEDKTPSSAAVAVGVQSSDKQKDSDEALSRINERKKAEKEARKKIFIDSIRVEGALKKLTKEKVSREEIIEFLEGKDELGKKIAFSIGRSVYERTKKDQKVYNEFIQHILDEHTGKKLQKSYYNTREEKNIKEIIEETIKNPDNYRFGQENEECRLNIVKNFNPIDKKKWVGNNSLGTTKNKEANYVMVCINVNDIHKEQDKTNWTGGTLKTSYPHFNP